jgi:hypothetical protein
MSSLVGLPVVDETYWLSRARVMLDAAIASREEAAGKLVSAIGWFWTVYSTVTVVGAAIARPRLSWVVGMLVSLPVAMLIIAYLFSLRVLIPDVGSFDPRVAEEVEEAYRKALATKCRRLTLAVAALVVSAVTVVAAVLATAIASGRDEPSIASRYVNKDGARVIVHGRVPDDVPVLISVTARADAGPLPPREVLTRPSRSGDVRATVPVAPAPGYSVSLQWRKGTEEHTLADVVKT